MEDALNDSPGPVCDAAEFEGAVSANNNSYIEALKRLSKELDELVKNLKPLPNLKNENFIRQHAFLLTGVEPNVLPRRLKKAYWKLFENRRVTWRERNKLSAITGER